MPVKFIEKTVAEGKQVLCGHQAPNKDVLKEAAEATGQPYVVERWLGGMRYNTTPLTVA